MDAVPDGFAELLVSLTRLMVDEESLEDTLRRVAYLACNSPVGADNAAVTLQRERGPATAAFFGDAALPLDRAQYEADDGPCLTAFRTSEMVRLDSIATNSDRWPRFATQAAEHGIRSSLSLPLVVRDAPVGALNLYASKPVAFSDEAVALATVFAAQAAVAIGNAEVYWRTYELTPNLEAALENRDHIGQAKGVLIATHGVSGDEAFDLLRRCSQHLNIKLRDVAAYVVRVGVLPTNASDIG